MQTDKDIKIQMELASKSTNKEMSDTDEAQVEETVEKVELTKRQRIIAAKKINLQRKRRQKLPPSLR
jgi:hypothetical protein|tara:strand:- start:1105 stop:1305 length:201 start_codon:yes stop_codon:yes gene_type:complete